MSAPTSSRSRAVGAAGRTLFAAVLAALVVLGAALSWRYGDVVAPLLGALR
jgi:hypothetical protein